MIDTEKTVTKLSQLSIAMNGPDAVATISEAKAALRDSEQRIHELEEQVANLSAVVSEIRSIPYWADGEGNGGFDVDGDEWKMIRELTSPLSAIVASSRARENSVLEEIALDTAIATMHTLAVYEMNNSRRGDSIPNRVAFGAGVELAKAVLRERISEIQNKRKS